MNLVDEKCRVDATTASYRWLHDKIQSLTSSGTYSTNPTLMHEFSILTCPEDMKEEPTYERYPIEIRKLEHFGIKSGEIGNLLTYAQRLGNSKPSIYCRGSIPRKVGAKMELYEYPPGEKKWDIEADIDLILPQEPFAKTPVVTFWNETTRVISDPRYRTTTIQKLRVTSIPSLEEFEEVTPPYDLEVYRTEANLLQAISALYPASPVIRFFIDDTQQIKAELVLFSSNNSNAFNPRVIGTRAYANAINEIKNHVGETYPIRINPLAYSYMRTFKPESTLIEVMKKWKTDTEVILSQNPHDNAVTLSSVTGLKPWEDFTRYIGLVCLSINNVTQRDITILSQYPLESIYQLGRSGLLSLMLQTAIFLEKKQIVKKLCDMYIEAIKQSQTPQTPYFEKLLDVRSQTSKQFTGNEIDYNQLAQLIINMKPECFETQSS